LNRNTDVVNRTDVVEQNRITDVVKRTEVVEQNRLASNRLHKLVSNLLQTLVERDRQYE